MKKFVRFLPVLFTVIVTTSCIFSPTTPTPVPNPTPTPTILIATPTPLGADALAPIDVEEQLVTNLYERAGPSVVHITTRVVTMNFFFGPTASEGTGSGFVWDEDGHIVTNYHVIQNAESVEVKFSDDVTVPAQVVGVDPPNDLAVLRVDLPAEQLYPLELGDSEWGNGPLPLATPLVWIGR